jgi:hypothetical protein
MEQSCCGELLILNADLVLGEVGPEDAEIQL